MPWLSPDDILSYDGDGGPFADLVDEASLPLGTALYDAGGPIRARLLSSTRTRDPLALLRTRLERAEHRRRVDTKHTASTAYRLCHGEADGVPGLFVDCFGDGVVADVDAEPLLPYLDALLDGLFARLQMRTLVVRAAGTSRLVRGSSTSASFQLEGLDLDVDLVADDVRRLSAELDAMRRLRPFARGRVLDVYANTGGFAIQLLDGGASEAVLIDSSRGLALRAANDHTRNGLRGPLEVIEADPLRWLKKARGSFDLVVCHPPHEALPPTQAEERAIEIASAALRLVGEGAIFAARSSSASLDDDRFAAALQDAGSQYRRRLQVLARLGPGPDHPTLAGTRLPPSVLVMRVLSTS